jgi:DNA-binding transcriptional regulator PaaX
VVWGKLEAEAIVKRRKRDLRRALLITVAVTGVIALSAISPNMFRLFKITGANARLRYTTKRVLGRLKQKGEIEFIEQNGKKFVQLTKRGEQALAVSTEKMRLIGTVPTRWDKRYRLVMFDISEKRKKTRDFLRREMIDVGFLRVQDSAWVYPYDCEEFVALLKADLHIGKEVVYAVVESIENDMWIRKHFKLPSN